MPVTAREKTFAPGDQVPSATLNTMQDDTILVSSEVGDPAALTTSVKTSTVAAINSLVTELDGLKLWSPYDLSLGRMDVAVVASGVDYLVAARAFTLIGLRVAIVGTLGSASSRWDLKRAVVSGGSLGAFASILATKPQVAAGKRVSSETGGYNGVAAGGGVAIAAGDVLRLDSELSSGAVGYVVTIEGKVQTL